MPANQYTSMFRHYYLLFQVLAMLADYTQTMLTIPTEYHWSDMHAQLRYWISDGGRKAVVYSPLLCVVLCNFVLHNLCHCFTRAGKCVSEWVSEVCVWSKKLGTTMWNVGCLNKATSSPQVCVQVEKVITEACCSNMISRDACAWRMS